MAISLLLKEGVGMMEIARFAMFWQTTRRHFVYTTYL
jgi:hypothetical protein